MARTGPYSKRLKEINEEEEEETLAEKVEGLKRKKRNMEAEREVESK